MDGGVIASTAAPELAYRIGHHSGLSEDDVAARAIAHAILGGAVAAVQGNSAAAGTAGTATGELAAKAIAGVLYPDVTDLSKLSEEQKQTISTLATISAGMAGGLAGDSTGFAVAGGQAGKNAAENNSLSKKDKDLGLQDTRPGWLKPGIIDENGEQSLAGGGIAKGGKSYPGTQQSPMLGEYGVQTASKTIWKGTGKERIDVENPNPGQRPGQLHYQDNKGNKYLYDPKSNSFPDAPKSVNNLLNDSSFRKAINKGMVQYLGEKK